MRVSSLVGAALLGLSLSVGAQPSASQRPDKTQATDRTDAAAAADRATVLDSVNVIGSKDAAGDLPGSGVYLDRADITTQGYEDIHRVLRQVPGVYIREEDGYGLFPNLSLRGADPGRSSKLTLMEDGVLTAPAPYSDPAAYYSPNVARMAGLEILKGSSQVRFGPHSTGGVINYLSTPVPQTRDGYSRTSFGSDNDLRTHSWFGDRQPLGDGTLGWLVEGYYRETDGFKELDAPFSSVGPDANETGFRRTEPMIKLAWEPGTETYQRLEFKYGTSDLNANETYLGLTEADFAANPHRRYAGSRFDNIATEHERLYLRHFIQSGTGTDLTTTVYRNDFHRNWFKIFRVNDTAGNSNCSVNGGSETCLGNVGLGRALADDADSAQALAVLRGEAAGRLDYRNNNREYYLRGVETLLTQVFSTGGIEHTVRAGLRWHEDRIFRFQNDETFTQDAGGLITGHAIGAPGSQENRQLAAKALAFHLEDRISTGRFSLIPGVRVEQLDWTFDDFGASPAHRTGNRTLVAGGLGMNWEVSEAATLFGGVYRGMSPPDPASATAPGNEQKEETSLSAELGARLRGPQTFMAEAAVFATKFKNLVVTNNIGATGTGSGGAVGAVDSCGVELALRYDAGSAAGWRVATPLALAATWTRAEIANDSTSSGSGGANVESIFSGARKSNRLPYIPEWQTSLTAGIHGNRWQFDAALVYVDEAFATALNTEQKVIVTGVDGMTGDFILTPDARGGTIDRFFTVDLSAGFQMTDRARLFVNVHNLFDEEYVASRLPEGPRPGTPRTALAGIELRI
jgi:Fe(3+) dicitrate transport protein